VGKLEGKVAIVTGGARGQGGAEATLFRSEGAEVIVTDVLREEGEGLAKEIGATFIAHDVRSEEEWAEVVRQAIERHGRIDVLVNNAGIFHRAKLVDTDLATYRRIIDVNQIGVYLGMRAVAPTMIDQGSGSIVNISSVAGIGQSLHQEPAYAASKGAVRIFTKVTASQHAKDRIRCNSVHPGPVDTEMFHRAFADREAMQRRLDRVPLRRMGTVAEVVSAVLYLASDEASYITGSELVIDGGALAQ
jgi:cyclopentanol dehydrogenase